MKTAVPLQLYTSNLIVLLGVCLLDLRRLKPKEKVSIAIDMTDACVSVCAEGIRAQHPEITEEELLERLRKRIEYTKRRRRCEA